MASVYIEMHNLYGVYLLYYNNVHLQDTGGIQSAAKFKQMTRLEWKADCSIKCISTWNLHGSLQKFVAEIKINK